MPVYMYLCDTTSFFSMDLQTRRRCRLGKLRCKEASTAASFQPEFACFRLALDRSDADSTSVILSNVKDVTCLLLHDQTFYSVLFDIKPFIQSYLT